MTSIGKYKIGYMLQDHFLETRAKEPKATGDGMGASYWDGNFPYEKEGRGGWHKSTGHSEPSAPKRKSGTYPPFGGK